jgi:hypothetical protein
VPEYPPGQTSKTAPTHTRARPGADQTAGAYALPAPDAVTGTNNPPWSIMQLSHEAERRWVLVLIQLELARIALLTQAAR